MNCLCCGKPLSPGMERTGWHTACIKKFFGTETIPEFELNNKKLEEIAVGVTMKGYTVPGEQKKMSLHLSYDRKEPKLTLADYPTGYILKPQAEEFEALPEAEQLVMCMADKSGIATVPHALIGGSEAYAFIMRRVDRVMDKGNATRLAMEDFCQLDLRSARDKYKGIIRAVRQSDPPLLLPKRSGYDRTVSETLVFFCCREFGYASQEFLAS